MSGKPAARVTDPTTCPVPGHGSNPIVQGSPDVVFDGLPAARQGDASACGNPMISAVSSTVLINGLPAVTLGSIGAHGNVVIGGSGTVLIGDVFTPAPRAPALPLNRNSVPCSGRFQLIDHETGKPVAGRRVRVWSSGGWNAFDTTDADGMTSWIERPTAEILYIDLVQRCDA
ncbi:TPA: PAAR domain-containing protein [Pseudomonas aeruginosa]